MNAQNMPAAEVEITTEIVAGLVASQHPDLADLTVRYLTNGWDNETFRLGDDLLVRLPRRSAGVELLMNELAWLPVLAPSLPLPIPAAVRVGKPDHTYPWPWAICPFIAGSNAMQGELQDTRAAGEAIGRFLQALHQPAPVEAPVNPYRGQPLTERDALTRGRINAIAEPELSEKVARKWDQLVGTTAWDGAPVWLHGDLHPGNLVIHEGAVAGVIDFGDITRGDPACDLMIGWYLLDAPGRDQMRATAGVAEDTWQRGRGWAITHALAVLSLSADNPSYRAMATQTLRATV